MFLPTRLDQVNDYSNDASKELIRVSGSNANPLNNPYLKFANMIGDYTKAKDQEGLDKAVGEFQQGLEQGRAIGDLLAKMDPRYKGDYRFIDNTNKARDAKNKDERVKIDWKNADSNRIQANAAAASAALARRRYEEDLASNRLIAEFLKSRAMGGTVLDATFLDRHKDELLANPTAYKAIIGYMPKESLVDSVGNPDAASNVAIDAQGNVTGMDPATASSLVQAQAATGLKNGKQLRGQFSWVGQMPPELAQAIDSGDEKAIVDHIKKVYGDTSDAEEINEAWGKAYRQAQNILGDSGVPKSAIFNEFLRSVDNPWLFDFWGLRNKYDKDVFANQLKKMASTYNIVQDYVPQVEKDTQLLEQAVKDNVYSKIDTAFATKKNIIMKRLQSGDLTPEAANLEIKKAAKERATALAPYIEASQRNRQHYANYDAASKAMNALKNAGGY